MADPYKEFLNPKKTMRKLGLSEALTRTHENGGIRPTVWGCKTCDRPTAHIKDCLNNHWRCTICDGYIVHIPKEIIGQMRKEYQ